MCDAEINLTDQERERAWDYLFYCLDYGDENARPIMMDQSRLIVLIHNLIKGRK